MSKINPYDLPPEEERNVRIVLNNIRWDVPWWLAKGHRASTLLPSTMSIPVDSNLPEEEMISKAIDTASDTWGYCILDCDVAPIDYQSPKADLSDSTLEYTGDIFANE